MSLHREEFLKLGKDVLTRECGENTTMCMDERNLFIDMIAREGSHEAQKLLVDLVIQQPNVTEEDLRRFLFHCIALKEPLPVYLYISLCNICTIFVFYYGVADRFR